MPAIVARKHGHLAASPTADAGDSQWRMARIRHGHHHLSVGYPGWTEHRPERPPRSYQLFLTPTESRFLKAYLSGPRRSLRRDLVVTQKLLGHADVRMTLRYAHVTDNRLR
jgi:hypothetical protein